MADTKGVIYILTNPSFPEYVKIGYADDVERRLAELNRSECIPFAFRIYATYEVPKRLGDLSLHRIIDKLNPSLRTIDTFNGKPRKKEFYAMSKEEAYFLLEAIAEIHDSVDKLKIWNVKQEEVLDEVVADEVKKENQHDFGYVEKVERVGVLNIQELYSLLDEYLKDKNEKGILKYDAYGNKDNVLYFVSNHLDKVFYENKGAKGWWQGNHRAWYAFEIRENYLSVQFVCKYENADRDDMYRVATKYTGNIGIKVVKDHPRYAGYFPYIVRMKRQGLDKELLYKVLDESLLPILANEEEMYK